MNRRKPKRNRTELIAFYVTKEEKEKIVSTADDNDQSVSDYCRKKLIKRSEEE